MTRLLQLPWVEAGGWGHTKSSAASCTLTLQLAQGLVNRSCSCILGPKVGITYIRGAFGVEYSLDTLTLVEAALKPMSAEAMHTTVEATPLNTADTNSKAACSCIGYMNGP